MRVEQGDYDSNPKANETWAGFNLITGDIIWRIGPYSIAMRPSEWRDIRRRTDLAFTGLDPEDFERAELVRLKNKYEGKAKLNPDCPNCQCGGNLCPEHGTGELQESGR